MTKSIVPNVAWNTPIRWQQRKFDMIEGRRTCVRFELQHPLLKPLFIERKPDGLWQCSCPHYVEMIGRELAALPLHEIQEELVNFLQEQFDTCDAPWDHEN